MKITNNTYLPLCAYSVITAVIYGGITSSTSLIMLGIIIMLYGFAGSNSLLLLSFLLYPFIFLIRIPDHQNIILIIIPEIVTMLAILSFLIRRGWKIRFDSMSMLLLMYAILNFINPALHIFEAGALPYIFKQYVLPIIFIIISTI